jgi:UDP-N-acetylglucosamine:LPS N-acetylglucosamine transferase/predicted metal-dependent phosphoesterase TrpH
MKKVLILTAGFGEGHNAASRNLRDALEFLSDEVKVEILDLFESTYGALNTIAKKSYMGVVQYAPGVWGKIYSILDRTTALEKNLGSLTRLRHALGDIIREAQPDFVVSTYPVYGHVIQELFRDHSERGFRFITVVTDTISVNSTWFRAPSDWFCVSNEATADVLRRNGVTADKVRVLGFPVSRMFAEAPKAPLAAPKPGDLKRVLYLINAGKKKSGKSLDRLLEIPDLHVTVTIGRDAELKAELVERTAHCSERVDILGWTNQMPQIMMGSHLIIGKAGGATVQEAIAAKTPMIVNQVLPGQEEGNAQLIEQFELGAVAESGSEVADLVEKAFAQRGRLWEKWKANLEKISRPDASLKLAQAILEDSDQPGEDAGKIKLFQPREGRIMRADPVAIQRGRPRTLLCDFHTHTNYSDGKLSVPELVDFYGRLGFDCLCVTDHLADPRRLIGKLAKLSRLTLAPNQVNEYFEVLARERERAWRKYSMILMTGIEFNKDGYTKKTSAHLLGIDLKAPIDPALDLPETIAQIHSQSGLAVASHPHVFKSEWGKNTLYLWENQDQFAPLIDAWEIANRNDIFSPVGLKKLPFLANSDFHKPKHIYSWKTLLYCEKNPEAIKDCIRRNEHVALTLYRDQHREEPVQSHGFYDEEKVIHQLAEPGTLLTTANG